MVLLKKRSRLTGHSLWLKCLAPQRRGSNLVSMGHILPNPCSEDDCYTCCPNIKRHFNHRSQPTFYLDWTVLDTNKNNRLSSFVTTFVDHGLPLMQNPFSGFKIFIYQSVQSFPRPPHTSFQ